MTSKRSAAKAAARTEAAAMIDIEARLAPFFRSHDVHVIDLTDDREPPTFLTHRRRRTPLRHEPV
jgi:hypothetical protein